MLSIATQGRTTAGSAVAQRSVPLIDNRLIWAALCLTVLGWVLFWAAALALLPATPLWLPLLLFVSGLALIPLRLHLQNPQR
jgi:hypothetical protein